MKISLATTIAALTLAFWLGGLTYMVRANAHAIAEHVAMPVHPVAGQSITQLDSAMQNKGENIDLLRDEVRANSVLLQQVNTTLARLEERLDGR